MTYCEFCGWEGDNDHVRVCPKCREYKGLVRPGYDDADLDDKIAEFKAQHPEWEAQEP